MKPHQIENWVLKIIDQVEAGQPNEDSRVELKSQWIEAKKAARLIAGHANAARGESILWIIGVDEKKGVMGADNMELANWYPQVQSQFEDLAPQLLTDLNVRVREPNDPNKYKIIVALLFETVRAPYVVKNPDGGQISYEVPWREGRGTRSAKRSDLIRLLSPIQKLPLFEVLKADFFSQLGEWRVVMELYVSSKNLSQIVIPFHRCEVWFEISNCDSCMHLEKVSLIPNDGRFDYYASGWTTPSLDLFLSLFKQMLKINTEIDSLSLTIKSTSSEVLIDGAGKLILFASITKEKIPEIFAKNDLQITVNLLPVDAEQSIPITARLVYSPNWRGKVSRWSLKNYP